VVPLLLVAGSLAQAADWTDAWRGSRWHVELEETLPRGVTFAAEANRAFRTRAFQLDAVLDCPEVVPSGKSSALVQCRFEAVSLRATVRGTASGELFSEADTAVLTDTVRRLQSTRIEITLSEDGKVTAVDLMDLKGTTRWESESRETLRRMAWDLVAGLSLKRPADWEQGWTEKNTPLMRAPLEPGGMGLSRTAHQYSVVEGTRVVASGGEGSFTAPYVPWESSFAGNSVSAPGQRGGPTRSSDTGPITGATADDSGRLSEVGPGGLANTPTDLTFSGELRSVAVFDQAGWLTERIYTMVARPTASSIGNMQGVSVYTNAHLRRIGAETPTLGPTQLVTPPGTKIDGIPEWVPVQTF
jgi:hypothetical protein